MSYIKILGMVGGGVAAVLIIWMFASKIMSAGFEWLFGSLLGVFVVAGTIALILKYFR
jgi:hypothetical protein